MIACLGVQRASPWTLGNDTQRKGLVSRQFRGRLSEVDQACSANAFDVSAVWSEIQIVFENLTLAVIPLNLEGSIDLHEFPPKLPRSQSITNARQLHRDRR